MEDNQNEIRKILQRNTEQLRGFRCLTIDKLAEVADLHESSIRKVEKNTTAASDSTIEKLASALGVTIEQLTKADISLTFSYKSENKEEIKDLRSKLISIINDMDDDSIRSLFVLATKLAQINSKK